jgi:serine/threonine protein kinase
VVSVRTHFLVSVVNVAFHALSLQVPTLVEQGCDLLSKLLVFEPGERIDAKDALLHPFFTLDLEDTTGGTTNSAKRPRDAP